MIGWADGHVEPREIARLNRKNVYGIRSSEMNLGWFDPVDNSPYDLK